MTLEYKYESAFELYDDLNFDYISIVHFMTVCGISLIYFDKFDY